MWQHRVVGAHAKIAPFASAAAAALVLLGCVCHEFTFCPGHRSLEQSLQAIHKWAGDRN
jgi:hypothetical protein